MVRLKPELAVIQRLPRVLPSVRISSALPQHLYGPGSQPSFPQNLRYSWLYSVL